MPFNLEYCEIMRMLALYDTQERDREKISTTTAASADFMACKIEKPQRYGSVSNRDSELALLYESDFYRNTN